MSVVIRQRTSAWLRERRGFVTDRESPGLCRAGVEVDGVLRFVCLLPEDHAGECPHRWMNGRGYEVVYDPGGDRWDRLVWDWRENHWNKREEVLV